MENLQVLGIGVLVWVPLMHFWLHSLLSFWKKSPFLFYGFAFFLLCGSVFISFLVRAFGFPLFESSFVAILIGLGLMLLGMFFVLLGILTIGFKRFFLWAVFFPNSVEQKRITKGLYGYFPHPAYIGWVLLAVGNFVSNGEIVSLVTVLIVMFSLPVVIYFEERELSARAG